MALSNHEIILLVVQTIMTTFTLAIFALRLYTRLRLSKYEGMDDWCMLGAVVAYIGTMAIGITGAHLNHQLPRFYQLRFSYILWKREAQMGNKSKANCCFCEGLVKLSLVQFYRRLFASPVMLKALYSLTIVLSLATVGFTLANLLLCIPIARHWDRSVEGHCGDRIALDRASGIYSIVTDILILILPMKSFLNLKIPWKQRLMVLILFSLGLINIVSVWPPSAVLQLSTLSRVARIQLKLIVHVGDAYRISVWSTVETALAIICGSIPALKPLFMKYGSKLFPTMTDNQNKKELSTNNTSSIMDGTTQIASFDYVDKRNSVTFA